MQYRVSLLREVIQIDRLDVDIEAPSPALALLLVREQIADEQREPTQSAWSTDVGEWHAAPWIPQQVKAE